MKSYYLLVISVVFICGIILTAFSVFASFSSSFLTGLIIIFFAFSGLSIKIKKDFLFVIFLFCLIFFLGVVRYNAQNFVGKYNIKNYLFRSPDKVLVKGTIKSDPLISKRKTSFTLDADSIKEDNEWKPADGFAHVTVYGKDSSAFRYGDIVVLEGRLRQPFSYRKKSRFDYGKYLANKRIYSILDVKKEYFAKKIGEDKKITTQIIQTIYSIRAKLESHIETFLEAPYSSVLTAILLGKREKIPFWLKSLFAKTGTLHILAISGLHVGIIYFALKTILKIARIQKNFSIVLCISFLICYAVLAGGRASILRATIMFSIIAFGEILKRKTGILNLIGLSSLIILIANPNQVFDLGFMLSYTAVLSIVCISPLFYRIFCARGARNYLLRSVSISMAAWTGLLPLIAYFFGLISPIVVIANLIVIPLTFMIMGAGLLFISLGFLSKFLATIFSQSAWFFIFALIKSTNFLKSLPFSYFEITKPHVLPIILYYLMLLAVIRAFTAKNQLFSF